MKKNCENCDHLGYIEDQSYEMQDGGYFCEKRQYKTEKQEGYHLSLLNYSDGRYKQTAKSCCELEKQTV